MRSIFITLILAIFFGVRGGVFASPSLVDLEPDKITLFHKIASKSYDIGHHARSGTMERSFDKLGDIRWEITPFGGLHAVGFIFCASDSPFIVVSFPGSYWLSDWVQNVKFLRDPAGCIWDKANDITGSVHRGFSQIVRGFYPNFEAIVNELFPDLENKQFVFIGHSLGGGLSRLTASIFAHHRATSLAENQVKVVTFSSPRVGDYAFNMGMEDKIGRRNIIDFRHKADFLIGIDDWVVSNLFRRSDVGIRIEVGLVEKLQHSIREVWGAPVDETLRGGFNPLSLLAPISLVYTVFFPKLHTFDDAIIEKTYRHFKERLLLGVSLEEAAKVSFTNPERNPLFSWFRK